MKQLKKTKIIAGFLCILLLSACTSSNASSSKTTLIPSTASSLAHSTTEAPSQTNSLKDGSIPTETAGFEGFVKDLNLTNKKFSISVNETEVENDGAEGEEIFFVSEGGSKQIVYTENTVFIRSLSDDRAKKTEYFEGTEEDLQLDTFVKIWGNEADGIVTASKILVMQTTS